MFRVQNLNFYDIVQTSERPFERIINVLDRPMRQTETFPFFELTDEIIASFVRKR